MSDLFSVDRKDLLKGVVMAIIGGAMLPVLVAVQDPSFNVMTAPWQQLAVVALNGAVMSFATYITKNFFSDSEGKIFGKIG